MTWSTPLPDAIDQLVLIAKQAEELADVDVRDGPDLADTTATSILYIGWTGGTSETDAETQVAADGMAGDRDLEQSVIRCTASVLVGNGTMSDARRLAYSILDGLGSAIARNRTLNLSQSVLRAQIGSHTLTQQQTNRGVQIAVTAEVELQTFTSR